MLKVIKLKVILQIVILFNVIRLKVILLIVILLNVISLPADHQPAKCCHA
jgi:hypothetical protein